MQHNLFDQIRQNQLKTKFIMVGFFIIVSLFGLLLGGMAGGNGNDPDPLFKAWFYTVLIAGIYTWLVINQSINVVMVMNHGTEITHREQAPALWDAVGNMAIAAGLPMPRVFIINDPSPNAMATGNDPQHAAIGATRGILKIMNKYELEGVIGHEMSHIKNYDIRVGTVGIALTSLFAFISGFLMQLCYDFSFFDWLDDDDNSDNDDDNSGALIAIGLFLAVVSWICSGLCHLTSLALSRNREYLADAGSVDLTRNPEELIQAFEVLKKRIPMRAANPASNSLYIVSPRVKGFLSQLFDDHPPLDQRIKRLLEMEFQTDEPHKINRH